MIATPNNREELKQLEKANNFIAKIQSTGKLSGIYPAYKKVSKWNGANDAWDVYFIAAKQYHSLVDDATIANISYDAMMCKMKDSYYDYAGRELKVFKSEEETIKYLQND